MKLEVISITDNDDGSATVVMEIDEQWLKAFAQIGILKVLTDAAQYQIDKEAQYQTDEEAENEG